MAGVFLGALGVIGAIITIPTSVYYYNYRVSTPTQVPRSLNYSTDVLDELRYATPKLKPSQISKEKREDPFIRDLVNAMNRHQQRIELDRSKSKETTDEF